MLINSRSALVFLCLFYVNNAETVSRTVCGNGTEVFSAKIRYDNKADPSESTFADCVTGNNITEIALTTNVHTVGANTFVNMAKLRKLTMVGNGIRYLKPSFIRNTPNLKYFSAFDNKLATIQKDVFNGLNVGSLWLGSNEISVIETGAFAKLKLDLLSLNGNKLTEIDGSWFHGTTIYILNFDYNHITKLYADAFKEVKNLTHLSLKRNSIYFIEDKTFSGQKVLYSLVLSWNSLNNINFLNDTKVEFINLSFNQISNMVMNESMKFKEMVIYPNPWSCRCLMKFWRYAWKHGLKYWYAFTVNSKTRLLCVAHGENCDSDYIDLEVSKKYFKLMNYAKLMHVGCFFLSC